jgi:hypothetical protein
MIASLLKKSVRNSRGIILIYLRTELVYCLYQSRDIPSISSAMMGGSLPHGMYKARPTTIKKNPPHIRTFLS